MPTALVRAPPPIQALSSRVVATANTAACLGRSLARRRVFFFFNDTATTEIYTLSLHDALPISTTSCPACSTAPATAPRGETASSSRTRSEEHTSELQSPCNLVCRLLLEKKKERSRPGGPT